MSAVDISAVRAAFPLSAVVGTTLVLRRSGGEFVACCPFHNEKTPSFTVNDAKSFYHCFGCGAHGDVLDFVQQTQGVGLREAADLLGAGSFASTAPPRAPQQEPERDTTGEAVAIWRASGPAAGTAAEAYLRWRGIDIEVPPTIRFARLRYGSSGPQRPCLVALVASVDNKAIGIQRTYLRDDGRGKADVPKPKLSLGRVRGGAIRLTAADRELIVCEGLEDGLSLSQELPHPVWVSAGACMLPSMRFPGVVRSIVIGADSDAAGDREARKALDSYRVGGRAVRIIKPLDGFKDFNDELQGGQA
jgi:DNA primase